MATKPGEMIGRHLVREWNPSIGNAKSWHETLDHAGKIRIVRPQRLDNIKRHYSFTKDGYFEGSW